MSGSGAWPAAPMLTAVLQASLAGAVFGALVWGACRLLPRLPVGVRAGLWWAVGLRLLLGLLPWAAVELPLLPAAGGVLRPAPAVASPTAVEAPPGRALRPLAAVPLDGSRSPSAAAATFPWVPALAALWLLGAALGLAATARQLARLRRLRRCCRRLEAGRLVELCARLAGRLGLSRPPELRLSPEVETPQVVGLLRPAVLLPAGIADTLPGAELAMLLCHELVHLRRRDLLWGWAPALAQRLFFFHPAAHLAAREYSLAREAACDVEVLRVLGTAPRDYGRLLLRWGATLADGGLVAAAAAPSPANLKRRIEMLGQTSSSRRRWLVVVLATAGVLLGLLPIRLIARPADALDAAAAASRPASTAGGAAVSTPASTAVASAGSPVAPSPAAAATAPGHGSSSAASSGSTMHYAAGSGSRLDAWIYTEDGSSTTMSGSTSDWEGAMRAIRGSHGPVLWMRRGAKAYVIRDPGLLAEAQRILAPMNELGEQQGRLGAQQGELGSQQGELGSRQGELGSQQGQLGARQGELGSQQAQLAAEVAQLAVEEARLGLEGRSEESDARRDDLARRRRDLDRRNDSLGDKQRELGDEQRELGKKQRELGEKQRELGERQRALGEQQHALGEQQREASRKAEGELADLLDRALAQGLAEEAR